MVDRGEARLTTLTLRAPAGFDLERAVCSYGFYVLAPNRWDAATATLHRPLRDAADRVIGVRVRQRAATVDGDARLVIRCDRPVDRAHHAVLKRQVRRMLQFGLDPAIFERFQALFPLARRVGFGRIFRSPTLFEDMIKTLTGCNVAWRNTMQMNRRLCERIGSGGDFPTPTELAAVEPDVLNATCRVGYRAAWMIELARRVADGELDLDGFEQPGRTTEELYAALREIRGFGDYAANNILQLLGRFDRLPIDTETIRHMREHHGLAGETADLAQAAREHYARYSPFDFLAYWCELWHHGYEDADWR